MNSFSLIIPVFNGSNYLDKTFLELDNFCKIKPDLIGEIIFIDDGSNDGTREKLNLLSSQFNSLPIKILGYSQNQGKGFALSYALSNTNIETEFFGFTDVDLPYGLEQLEFIKQKLETHEVVVGNRYLSNQAKEQYTFYRYVLSRFFHFLLPSQVRAYQDTQCGFKFFRLEEGKKLFASVITHNWVFDVELFILSKNRDYKIYEVPVILRTDTRMVESNVSWWKHSLEILKDLYRIHNNFKQGRYS